MMLIDFLPEHYRQMQQRRRAGVWRVLAVGVVLIVMAASSTMVVWQRQGLAHQIEGVRRGEQDVKGVLQEVALLKQEKTKLGRLTTLLFLTRCQLPMSRMVGEIATAVPDTVTITSLSISKQTGTGSGSAPSGKQRGRRRRAVSRRSKHFDKKASAVERLRQEAATSCFSVVIQGLAESDTQIALMLGRLSQSSAFEKASMSYSEPADTKETKRRKFQVVCQSVSVVGGDPR